MEVLAILLAILLLVAPITLSIIALVVVANHGKKIEEQWKYIRQREMTAQAPPSTPRWSPPSPESVPPASVPPPPPDDIPAVVPAPPAVREPADTFTAHPRQEVSQLEAAIGKHWITWLGALALFIGAGFFVKYAIENAWLGPTARITVGILFGVLLLVVGDRVIRRPMRALGEGLMGSGLAIVFLSLYAGFAFYGLIPAKVAFTAMALLTACGMTLAVLHNARALVFLAVLGGFLTPVMVSTGTNARDILFTYLLLLDLGVLGVSFFKGWRAVDTLAFAGTWLLFVGWFSAHYSPAQLTPTVIWISAFYLVFLFLPFLYHLRYRLPISVERFVLALFNAGIAFGFLYAMLTPAHREAMGFIALGMSATTLGMGSLTRRKLPGDSAAIFGFIALAVAFLTLAIPLQLKAYGISLLWAIEGPVLLYLGYRFRYFPVRVGGFIVLALAVIQLFLVHWPLHSAAFVPIANLRFVSAFGIAVIIAAYALVHHRWRHNATLEDRVMKIYAGIGAGLLATFLLQIELSLWLSFIGRHDLSRYIAAVTWALGGLLFVTVGTYCQNLAVKVIGVAPLLIAGIVLVSPYSAGPQYALALNPRFGAGLFVMLALFFSWWQLYRQQVDRELQQCLFALFEGFLLLLLSLEAYTWAKGIVSDAQRAGWLAQMSLSLTWGLFAIVLLASGFQRRARGMRLTALCLFGITAVKLLIVDLATLQQLYRILSFFGIGLLMIGASYLYHRIEKHLESPEGDHS